MSWQPREDIFKFHLDIPIRPAMIVLHWLSSDSCRWKTFVSNRVSQIQDLTEGLYMALYIIRRKSLGPSQ
ncbi:hypothetical protein, partial [Klebsiella pneumoniae]|uniref:hypothetical protein n=1 Tax=Klebsiella pneumoniae TaxID=573 RepID=UPI0040558B8A